MSSSPRSLTQELAADLRAVVTRLTRELRQQTQTASDLTTTQLSVLGSIYRSELVNLSDLASRERLSLPMISKVVVSLESRGLIVRVADAHDRRVCLVRLSAEGRRWMQNELSRSNAWLAERVLQLEPDEREALRSAVRLLERLVGEERRVCR